MDSPLPSRDLVLVGAGHTNAHVLRMWRMRPVPDVRLTVVSPFSIATYSGMLPGTLAGLYEPDEMEIDLRRLCASTGARLIVAAMTGLDPARRLVHLADRPPLSYDVLSIGIGSVPSGGDLWRHHPDVLSIKPMQTFRDRLRARLEVFTERRARIAVVGAGAAGTEVSLCLAHGFAERCEVMLVDAADVLPGYVAGTRRRAVAALEAAGVERRIGSRVSSFEEGRVRFEDGRETPADLVVWAVGAAPPDVLADIDLPKADDGFLAVDRTLRTTAGYDVFVVGDTATIVDHPLPKAGVYAVREGPVLWDNVRAVLAGRPLRPYRPQSRFLSLLATGDGRAIGEYAGWSFTGRWVWRWKNRIDQRFMEMYRDHRPMRMPAAARNDAERMRCRGCGGKVGASVLDDALARLGTEPGREDAALLAGDDATVDLVSIDVFHAFTDDPYLVGRVAALNAASDIWANGGRPTTALATVTIPEGRRSQQVDLLHQTLAGAVREFDRVGITLRGGHTRAGDEWSVGFVVHGRLDGGEPFANDGLRDGDALVLTKPLGTGALLAAHMECACRAEWYDGMTASMLIPNDEAATIARRHGVRAATDVTGFGLAGHLFEMLDAGGLSARLDVEAIPRLPGFDEVVAAGHRSSLDPANRSVADRIDGLVDDPACDALFDPQTSGGLLLAVEESRVAGLVEELGDGGSFVARIGTVVRDAASGVATPDRRTARVTLTRADG